MPSACRSWISFRTVVTELELQLAGGNATNFGIGQVRALPGEDEGRRRGQPVQQPRRRPGGGGGAHDLHA